MKQLMLAGLKNKSIFICSIFIFFFSANAFGDSSLYFPDEKWRVSTPEEQGMSSHTLAVMVEKILLSPNSIDSVTIIRNGYMVLDICFYPFQEDTEHIIHSCTKSVMSTLIGIAIDKGYIKDVNQRLLDFFPGISLSNMTPTKKHITLENVLTMSTGLESRDSYKYKWAGLIKMKKSRDWTKYMLDLPMKEEPGNKFEYSNGTSYLLSALLQNKTGMRSLEFAKEHLFNPLDIQQIKWKTNLQGIDVGYGEMWLKPHDMAKFGWLFLKKGKWKDKTIVSEKWVVNATKGRLDADLFDQYGYQWWVGKNGWYAAVGYGGQRIFVVPQFDMVAVFTSHKAFRKSDRFMRNYVLKSVVSDQSVEPNHPEGLRLKNLAVKAKTPPERSPVAELSTFTKAISGKKYYLSANRAGFTDFTIILEAGKSHAILKYGVNNKNYTLEMGLDGIYRTTEVYGEKIGIKGEWLNNKDSFRFSSVNIGHTEGNSGLVNFIDNRVHITMFGPYGGTPLKLEGVME